MAAPRGRLSNDDPGQRLGAGARLADVTEDGMLVLRTGRGAVTTTTTEHIEPRGSTVANRRC